MSKRTNALNDSTLGGLRDLLPRRDERAPSPEPITPAEPEKSDPEPAEEEVLVKETYRLPLSVKARFEQAFAEIRPHLARKRTKVTRNDFAVAILELALNDWDARKMDAEAVKHMIESAKPKE